MTLSCVFWFTTMLWEVYWGQHKSYFTINLSKSRTLTSTLELCLKTSWFQEQQSASCKWRATSSSMTWCYVTLSRCCRSASQDKPLSCSSCEHELTDAKIDSLVLAIRQRTKKKGGPESLCFTLGTSSFCESAQCPQMCTGLSWKWDAAGFRCLALRSVECSRSFALVGVQSVLLITLILWLFPPNLISQRPRYV